MHPVQPAHILIVDDAPISLEVLLSILDPDYDVSIATSGEQALQQLQPPQALPDLILLDVTMPGLDGYQVCERLRADPRTRDIPVLFVTASTDAESETRAYGVARKVAELGEEHMVLPSLCEKTS